MVTAAEALGKADVIQAYGVGAVTWAILHAPLGVGGDRGLRYLSPRVS